MTYKLELSPVAVRYAVRVRPHMMDNWQLQTRADVLSVAIDAARSYYRAGNYDTSVFDTHTLTVVWQALIEGKSE